MLYQQSQPGVRYFGPRQSAALFFGCSIFSVVVWHTSLHFVHEKKASRFQLNMQIVDAGIINGFETLIKICGYIMMFSIFTEIVQSIPYGSSFQKLVLTGCLEVTNGISVLSQFSCTHFHKILLTTLFLSLNGISGLFQTASLLGTSDLSMRLYLKMKLLLVSAIMAIATVFLFLGILV